MTEGLQQIDAMRSGVDYRFPVKVRSFELDVRPLSLMETVTVAQRVAEAMKSVPESARNRLTEHSFLAKFTLETASTSDVGAKDPKITEYVLDRMTAEELMAIFKQYVAIVDRANPVLDFMTPAELEAILDELKKNRLELTPEDWDSQLIELSFSQLVSITRFLLTKDD